MRKMFVSVLVIAAFSSFVGACSKDGNNSSGKQAGENQMHKKSDESQLHQGSTKEATGSGIADVLKSKTLAKYPRITIGTAFDGYKYFTKREWKETRSASGKIYVDFVGWLDAKSADSGTVKDGVSGKALDVKFVIEPDGSFYVAMMSRIEEMADGRSYDYPLQNSADMLSKIYANKAISF